jgi:uncharacterized phiE125 gp8 family phage protein
MSFDRIGIKTITAPAAEPVLVADAKLHLRIVGTDEDTYLTHLIKVAREKVERDSRRALITQTLELQLDRFPAGQGVIALPYAAPLQSVTSVTYTDTAGAATVLSTNDYESDIDVDPGRVRPVSAKTWPSTDNALGAVRVRYVCGYGTAGTSVPSTLLHCMYLLIEHWYCNRGIVVIGSTSKELEITYQDLIQPYAVLEMS